MLVNEAFSDVASFLDLRDLAALLFTSRSTSPTASSHIERRLSYIFACAWLPKLTTSGSIAYEFWSAAGEKEIVPLPKTTLDEASFLLLRNCTFGYPIFHCYCGTQEEDSPCVSNAVSKAAGLFVVTGAIHLNISECASFTSTSSVIDFLADFHKFRRLMITDTKRKLWSEETSALADEDELVAYCKRKGLLSLEYTDWAEIKVRFELAPAAE